MIDVAILSVIRRWHLRDQMPIREIARRTGLSRTPLRSILQVMCLSRIIQGDAVLARLMPTRSSSRTGCKLKFNIAHMMTLRLKFIFSMLINWLLNMAFSKFNLGG